MTHSRTRSLWAAPALVLLTSACGNPEVTTPTDTETETEETETATVTATANPGTVTATASTDAAYRWSGSFDVTINNINESPITITSISTDLQQSSGGIAIVPITGTDESFRFNVRAPGNRVDVNSTMVIPFTFFYSLPNGGREALVSLAFGVTTDSGSSGTVTATVTLQ